MARIGLVIGLLGALALFPACDGKKKAGTSQSGGDEADVECKTSADCEEGYRCSRGHCMKPLRSNNPTAEGVKRDIERHQKRHTDNVDRSLDLPE